MKNIDTKSRINKTMCLEKELDSFMNYIGLDSKMQELQILDVWNECVGETISNYSTPVEIRKNKLFVKAENAAWRYELSLKKKQIIDNLNTHLKNKIIKEIIFI